MLRILFSFIFFMYLSYSSAQVMVYDIFIAGKNVGNSMVTKKRIDSTKTYYSALTDVKYSLFKDTQLVYLYEAIFKQDTLQNAFFIHKKNGEVSEETKIERLANRKYYSTLIDNQKDWHDQIIKKSMVQAYFNQPLKRDSLFSERFHEYVQVAKLPEENKYMFIIPNGDKNIYEYDENGTCVNVKIKSTFIDLEMVLRHKADD